jgi:hypothetical protein
VNWLRAAFNIDESPHRAIWLSPARYRRHVLATASRARARGEAFGISLIALLSALHSQFLAVGVLGDLHLFDQLLDRHLLFIDGW